MRKVYDRGGFDIQLCASYPLWNLTSRWTLNAYGAVEYFHRSGQSINGYQKTSLWSVPINIGLKPVYAMNGNMQYYFAIGPRYFYIHQRNHSPYVYKNKSRNGLGFFVNTGFNYVLCNHFVIDIFGEYSYGKMHFHSGKSRVYTRNIQIGGFAFGGGIGYSF
jgi:outer membrane protein W